MQARLQTHTALEHHINIPTLADSVIVQFTVALCFCALEKINVIKKRQFETFPYRLLLTVFFSWLKPNAIFFPSSFRLCRLSVIRVTQPIMFIAVLKRRSCMQSECQ